MRTQGRASIRIESPGIGSQTHEGWVELGPDWVYLEIEGANATSFPRERVFWVEWKPA